MQQMGGERPSAAWWRASVLQPQACMFLPLAPAEPACALHAVALCMLQGGLTATLCGHGKPDICFVFVSSRR